MLSLLTRKLCPLISLAIFTIGCGKQINDPVAQPSRSTNEGQPSSTHILKLDGSESNNKFFPMPQNGEFLVPGRLLVRAGSTSGKKVVLKYDADRSDEEDYQFKCTYLPQQNYFALNNCVDYDGQDFGDVSEISFTLYQDENIQIIFSGATSTSDLVVEAIFEVDWK